MICPYLVGQMGGSGVSRAVGGGWWWMVIVAALQVPAAAASRTQLDLKPVAEWRRGTPVSHSPHWRGVKCEGRAGKGG